ncbi:MAG: c-type cytochrome [Microcoleus sp. SIO2G3]|nr:c-type cytochrome [Microcoleus sp. SIO2G3]
MQKVLWILSIGLAVFAALTISIAPAWAADVENGAKVFSANCAACHIGGGNVVNGAKTLKKEALEQYQMASSEAIVNQVLNGKNAMPAFKDRLKPEQIEDVAAYVLAQAEKGW